MTRRPAALKPLDQTQLVSAAKKLAHIDPPLAEVLRRLGPPPLWARPANYATFVHIILEQQVSLASAKHTFDRLRALCDRRVTPRRVAEIGESGLRNIGFTR